MAARSPPTDVSPRRRPARLRLFFPPHPGGPGARLRPGGDCAPGRDETLVAEIRRAWPFLAESHARRLVAAYGTRVKLVLRGGTRAEDLGARFRPDSTRGALRCLFGH